MLQWLWVMTNATVSFLMIHPNRSKPAFEALIQDWSDILVSDGYGLYCKSIERQTYLVHLIRKARELFERQAPELARFATWALAELERFCHMARAQPSRGEWQAFHARFVRLITFNRDRPDAAGRLAPNLQREMDSLWLFLIRERVAPTNNLWSGCCALPCAGARGLRVLQAIKAIAGWRGFSP